MLKAYAKTNVGLGGVNLGHLMSDQEFPGVFVHLETYNPATL
jgi:hypothetical protein